MSKCSFCANDFAQGKGKMFVLNSGKIHYFCSSKCEKNLLKLKRKPRLTKWTKSFVKGLAVKKEND